MGKDDMIKRLLREVEADFSLALRMGKIDRTQFNQALKSELTHLREKGYMEIEELYYTAAA
jgi:hypothetical protein